MSAPPRDRIVAAQRWVALADEHLRIARHAFSLRTSAPHRLIAFHAQQCAEAALKGLLVANNVDFPHTHSIVRLLELAGSCRAWAYESAEAEMLTPYAVVTRYTLEDEPVTRDEAELAVATAESVFEAVRAALARTTDIRLS